jgi:hypothetical protein
MIGLSTPFAHEHARDEDSLYPDGEHDVSEHDGKELHLPQFRSKAELDRRIRCLECELEYYSALRDGDDKAAQHWREQLFNAMSDDHE